MKKFVAAAFRFEGMIVVQRRDDSAPNNPKLLGFFGGRVEEGETGIEALKREISEETDLDMNRLQFDHLFDIEIPINNEGSERGIDSVFGCELISNGFKVKEGAGFEMYKLPDLLKRKDLSPFARVIAKKMQNYG